MVVDWQGRAYVGNFGFDYAAQETISPAEIVLVHPDGQARVVAQDVFFPNGCVITPDGRTFIVAETFGNRLTAFDIEPDGALSNPRLSAHLEGVHPDGIGLDAEGAVWVAAPTSGLVFRVQEGGNITDQVKVSTRPYACMLGGPGRRILFVCTSGPSISKEGRIQAGGRIEMVEVKVSGAGLP